MDETNFKVTFMVVKSDATTKSLQELLKKASIKPTQACRDASVKRDQLTWGRLNAVTRCKS